MTTRARIGFEVGHDRDDADADARAEVRTDPYDHADTRVQRSSVTAQRAHGREIASDLVGEACKLIASAPQIAGALGLRSATLVHRWMRRHEPTAITSPNVIASGLSPDDTLREWSLDVLRRAIRVIESRTERRALPNVVSALLRLARDHGDTAAAFDSALADDEITADEVPMLRRALRQLRRRLDEIDEHLDTVEGRR